ncbi:putative general alpha-glucoside permease [Naematelia encephala]|uniref:Putative general alpha-glucoside permease n=1 Tax=Naematelia encephala TaxID=71784 RepID=A0A1Y2AEP0_9TREE|nr:putative general alpha-glucoside permease [Naematelia encephala]
MILEAEAGTEAEHKMGLWKGLKTYPKASAWSIMISFAVVMEGFDVILLSNFYAYPAFVSRFGYPASDGTYQIPARWQSGLGSAASCGQIIGLLANGVIAERIGYRKTMIAALFAMIGLIFIFFFATSLNMLLAAEFLCGIPWGIFQTLTTSYAAEVAPVALRSYLTTWVNACWGIGQLISLAVLRGLLSRTDQWGWRIPYALQWIWPVPLILVAFFAPESPWWLVRRGRIEDAKRSLERLTSRGQDLDLDNTVAMMRMTNTLEKEITAGSSYLDCFRGVELRRTECVLGAWAVQQLCGSAFMSYSTYFFEQAGLSTDKAFDLSMAQYGINTGGTLIAWFLMGGGIGRRSLYLYGCIAMGIALIIIGAVSTVDTQAASWAAAIMLLMWSVGYQFSVGTICYSLVSELSSRRLLIKTINLGRGLYCVLGIVINILSSHQLDPTAWNWKGRTAFFWAGFDLLCVIWIYFRLPEPSGLTFAEIDKLFEMKVSARKFKQTGLDMFSKEKEQLRAVKQAIGLEKEMIKPEVTHVESIE